ncbi:MAG: prolyl oligopeptidase family serine peptidase [Pyrinomonadaceae bacterium]
MKRISIALALVLASCVFAHAQGVRTMTIEDALSIRDVGAPQWSPDGKWIAFTVSEWNRKDDRRDSHIYVIPAAGGQPIKLTNGERGESQPRWSPDSTRIAFLANRDTPQAGAATATPGATGGAGGRNQIWIIPVAGGEAEKVTDEEAGVAQFCWAPDGRRLAYVVRDTPQDKAERDKRRREKFDAVVVDSDFTYSHLWLIKLDTREKKRVTEGAFTVSDPQWSPRGEMIAYVASKAGAQESSWTDIAEDRNTDIYVAAPGAQPRQLTTNPGQDSQPRWSPDGRWIAYNSEADPMSWASKTDLMIVSVEGGTPRNLTSDYGNAVESAAKWSPDGQSLYVGGAAGVYGQLLRVAAAGGKPVAVFETPGAYTSVDLSPDGRTLAFLFDDPKSPRDLYVATSAGRLAKKLTDFNPQVKDFALGEEEVLRWKGADGLDIEGVVIKPVGYAAGTRVPTILQIHGGPYGQFNYGFNARNQIFAGHGYALVMPNPRGSSGYSNKFASANVRDWGGKDFQDIMAGVDEVIKRGVADPDRLGVMGGSYGGFMTFWTITQTDRFKAAIGHAGISDWYSFFGQSDIPGLMEYGFGGTPWTAREWYERWSPIRYAERVKTPLMITHGEQDRRVPIQQAEEYYRTLRKRGVETVFVRYPREGHGITEPNHVIDLVHRQLEWFDKHLKPGAQPVAATGEKR